MRWNFIVFTFSQERWNFLRMRRICAKTLQEMRWNFSTDVVNLCWNFARNALKFYCIHVFSKVLKLLHGCSEFALKLNKNCAEILLFYVFSKALKFSYRCVEFALKFCKKRAEIFLFSRFLKVLKLLYGCAEFALKLCKKFAEILLFSRFLKSAENFLWMCWICAETL